MLSVRDLIITLQALSAAKAAPAWPVWRLMRMTRRRSSDRSWKQWAPTSRASWKVGAVGLLVVAAGVVWQEELAGSGVLLHQWWYCWRQWEWRLVSIIRASWKSCCCLNGDPAMQKGLFFVCSFISSNLAEPSCACCWMLSKPLGIGSKSCKRSSSSAGRVLKIPPAWMLIAFERPGEKR